MNKTWQDSEKDFEEKIASLGKKAFLHRITDTKEVNRGKNFGKKTIVKAQPSDYTLTWNNNMAYAEVKHCSNETSFPFSNFTKGQMIAMRKQNAAGGKYLVFIYHAIEDTWYLLSGQLILGVIDEGNKSIPWNKIGHKKWNVHQF